MPKPAVVRFALAALAAALLLAACSDQVPAPATPTPRPTVTPDVSASATPVSSRLPAILASNGVAKLTQGDLIDPSPSYAFIMETGCWQCDGGTEGFVRVYGRSDGTTAVDELFNYKRSGYARTETKGGQTVETDPYITGFAFAPDASDMWISLCIRGFCGGPGILEPSGTDSEAVILRSRDGGVTWTETGRLSPPALIITSGPQGHAVVGTWTSGDQDPEFAYFPDLEPVPAPAPGYWPVGYLAKGGVVWRSSHSALEVAGRTIVDLDPNAGISSVFVEEMPEPHGDVLVAWNWPRTTAEQAYFLSMVTLEGRILETFEFPRFSIHALDLGKGLLAGNAEIDPSLLPGPLPEGHFTYIPVVIDTGQNTVRPFFSLVLNPDFPNGRNQIVAAQRGEFARVANVGTCLNVRAEPSESAAVLECAHEDVLLLDIEYASRLASYTPVPGWVEVKTPSGNHGWASADYLER